MSKLRPAHAPAPVRLKFTFKLSDAWVERHVVEHGTQPSETWEFEIHLTELDDVELRRRYLKVHSAQGALPAPTPLEVPTDDPVALLKQLEAWAALVGPPPDRFAEEMTAWIGERGSDRLKLAHARAYKVNATYARERAAIEYPMFWVDTNGSAKWRERTDPSETALAAETEAAALVAHNGDQERLVPRIAWLTEPPQDLASWCTRNGKLFRPGEAILVGAYLGRYVLVWPLAFPREEE